MSANKFTVLIIPEESRQVRRFQVCRRLVVGAGVCAVLLLLGGVLLLTDYLRVQGDRRELAHLQALNLEQQLALQELAVDMESLRQELVVLTQSDAQLRVLANLTPSDEDVMDGVGGPLSEAETSTALSDVQRQIERVRHEIELRRQSQEEIQGFLNDQRSLLAAKPQGWPVDGWMTSGFGMRISPFGGDRKMHEGLDIAAQSGTPVFATADGIVSQAATVPGYGKLVVVDHGYGYKTYYGHNSKIFVKVGQRVRRGDKISAVGNTGQSTGPHVHYEVRLNNMPINPRKFL